MGRYRKKPIEVEAFHYVGPSPELAAWMDQWADSHGGIEPGGPGRGTEDYEPDKVLALLTVQGEWVACRPGEWIIVDSGVGRFYPCASEVFERTYDVVDGRAWGS
jgi:hypothetical protein